MNTVKIKEEIREYLNKADDRFIKLVYGMITADREENLEVPKEHKNIIRERREQYNKNPDEVISWKEVQSKAEKKL